MEKTNEELVKEALELCNPTFQSEGGNVEFVCIDENNNVHIKLTGACGSCPASTMEIKMEVEECIKDACPAINEVINDSKVDYMSMGYYPWDYYGYIPPVEKESEAE